MQLRFRLVLKGVILVDKIHIKGLKIKRKIARPKIISDGKLLTFIDSNGAGLAADNESFLKKVCNQQSLRERSNINFGVSFQ